MQRLIHIEQNRKKKTCRPSRSKWLKPLMHLGGYVKLVHPRLCPPQTRRVCRNMVCRLAYLHLTINTYLNSETSKSDAGSRLQSFSNEHFKQSYLTK